MYCQENKKRSIYKIIASKLFPILLVILPCANANAQFAALPSYATCATPSALSGTLSVCSGSVTTLSDATLSGDWYSSTTSVATIGLASGIATGVSSGTTTITYLVSGGCYVTSALTVNTTPGAINGTLTVNSGSTTQLTDATASGTWLSSATAIATIGTAGLVSGVSAGTSTISYVLSTGCYSTAVVTVTSAGGGYTPTVAGVTNYWDASVSSTVHIVTGVSQWDTRTATGVNLLQATTTKQPVYSGSGVSGVITFDGSNDFLQKTFTLNRPCTVIMVVKDISWVISRFIIDGGGNASMPIQYGNVTPNITVDGTHQQGGLTVGVMMVVCVTYTSSATNISVNDNAKVSGTGLGVDPAGLTIGAEFFGGNSSNIAVQYIEIYSSALSSANQTTEISALRSYWGI